MLRWMAAVIVACLVAPASRAGEPCDATRDLVAGAAAPCDGKLVAKSRVDAWLRLEVELAEFRARVDKAVADLKTDNAQLARDLASARDRVAVVEAAASEANEALAACAAATGDHDRWTAARVLGVIGVAAVAVAGGVSCVQGSDAGCAVMGAGAGAGIVLVAF